MVKPAKLMGSPWAVDRKGLRLPGRGLRPLSILSVALVVAFWELGAKYVSTHFTFGYVVLPSLGHLWSVDLPETAQIRQVDLAEFRLADGSYSMGAYAMAFQVLAENAAITTARVLGGAVIGASLGVFAGIILAWNHKLERVVFPPLNLVRQIPLLAFGALFVYWFGGQEIGNYTYVAYGVFMIMIVFTLTAIKNVPPVYARFASTLGAGRLIAFRTVILPAAMPAMLGGFRLALGMAWAIALGAEFLAADSGIGRIVRYAEQFQLTGRMIVATFVIIGLALATNVVFEAAARRSVRWQPRL
jgi:ABC-type nitrate/sulfonate/bicarbonate transport system permease component